MKLANGWSTVFLGAAVSLAQAQGADPFVIRLHYQDRPPYSERMAGGEVRGLVATPAGNALRAAGVPFEWVGTPGARQLPLIQNGRGPDCGIGWFYSPAREALGRFSRPLYRDRPFAVVTRKDSPLREPVDVRMALSHPATTLVVARGFSYGAELDRAIQTARTRVYRAAVTNHRQLLKMVIAGRAVWMLINEEEAEHALQADPESGEALRMLHLSDAPSGLTRHIYCSKVVPPEVMTRIDRALDASR